MDPAIGTNFRRDHFTNQMGALAHLPLRSIILFGTLKGASQCPELMLGPVCHPKEQENSIFTGMIK